MLRQSYLAKKVHAGEESWLTSLREMYLRVEYWLDSELQKIEYQFRVGDVQESEKVRLYHPELHQKTDKNLLYSSLR